MKIIPKAVDEEVNSPPSNPLQLLLVSLLSIIGCAVAAYVVIGVLIEPLLYFGA